MLPGPKSRNKLFSSPYSENQEFIVPPDRPFLDSLTCLAFLAGCTKSITLGISVLVLPYRHPLYWARVAVPIERLSRGRLIMGVGVGWMEEEFAALGVLFKDRGRMTDEHLQIISKLWTEEHTSFDGAYYRFQDLAFYPKPLQQPRIPIWVGGEGIQAQRRTAKYGDAWFPYFVQITPQELKAGYDTVLKLAAEVGHDPGPDSTRMLPPNRGERNPIPCLRMRAAFVATLSSWLRRSGPTARLASIILPCSSWYRAGRSGWNRLSALHEK